MKLPILIMLLLLALQPASALPMANINDVIPDSSTYTYDLGKTMTIRADIYNPYSIAGQTTNLRYRYTLWIEKTNAAGNKYWAVDTYDSIKVSVAGGEIYSAYMTVTPPQTVGTYRYKITTEKYYNSAWRNDDSKIFSINVVTPVQNTPVQNTPVQNTPTETVSTPKYYSMTITSNVNDFYVACENVKYYTDSGKNSVTVSGIPEKTTYNFALCKDGYKTITFPVYLSQDASQTLNMEPTQTTIIENPTTVTSNETAESVKTIILTVSVEDIDGNGITNALINVDGAELKSSNAGNKFYLIDGDFTIVVTKDGYNAVIEEYSIDEETLLTIVMEEVSETETIVTSEAINVEVLTTPSVNYNSISTSSYLYGIIAVLVLIIGAVVYKIRKS